MEYDLMNPPADLCSGDNPHWTRDERDEWMRKASGRNDTLLQRKTQNFERKLHEFARVSHGHSEYVIWLRLVIGELTRGDLDLPDSAEVVRKLPTMDKDPWHVWRHFFREFLVTFDKEYETEGFEDEIKTAHYVLSLSPYRLWVVADACETKARDTVLDCLEEMCRHEISAARPVAKATRNAFVHECRRIERMGRDS